MTAPATSPTATGSTPGITDIVVVPAALLLLREYQGRAEAAPGLRASCVEVVHAAASRVDRVVVVHATDREPRGTRPAAGRRVAEELLAEAGTSASCVSFVEVAWDTPVDVCGSRGAELVTSVDDGAGRVALVVVGGGSARRTEKAPGHLDPRAAVLDEQLVAAIRGAGHEGGLGSLLDLEPELCADLLVTGRAPLQVAVAATGGTAYDVVSCDVTDPFGVLYVVAHLTRR